jgi:hypothetical protein
VESRANEVPQRIQTAMKASVLHQGANMKKLKTKIEPISPTQKNLFVPGYCGNPDDDEPLLNIRVFEENGLKVIYGFSSMETMNAFFLTSRLRRMKYMEIRPPEHLESARKLGLDLIIDPGT